MIVRSPGRIPNEINFARLNLSVALTLCAPATQPLKQSDIGGCSASVTPRMTKIERRAGRFPWRGPGALDAEFLSRSSDRVGQGGWQPPGVKRRRAGERPQNGWSSRDLAEQLRRPVFQTL